MSSNTIKVNISTYQKLAIQTKKEMSTVKLPIDNLLGKDTLVDKIILETKDHLGFMLDAIHHALGIIGEVGELNLAIENNDIINIREESGDICWFVAVCCNDNGLNFSTLLVNAQETLDEQNVFGYKGYTPYGFVDFVKKAMIYNDGIVNENYKDELEIYLTNILRYVINETYWRLKNGLEIENILEVNINKLYKRYGSKFSEYLANNRDLVSEREVLSSGDIIF